MSLSKHSDVNPAFSFRSKVLDVAFKFFECCVFILKVVTHRT